MKLLFPALSTLILIAAGSYSTCSEGKPETKSQPVRIGEPDPEEDLDMVALKDALTDPHFRRSIRYAIGSYRARERRLSIEEDIAEVEVQHINPAPEGATVECGWFSSLSIFWCCWSSRN